MKNFEIKNLEKKEGREFGEVGITKGYFYSLNIEVTVIRCKNWSL